MRRARALVEKNRRPGVKILMSGGTRCNITNARGLRRLDVVSGPIDPAYDRRNRAASGPSSRRSATTERSSVPALRRFDVDATVRMFEEAGVATKIEGNGKIFPVSDRATDVLDALSRRLERSGAMLRCFEPGARQSSGLEPSLAARPVSRSSCRTRRSPRRRVIVAVGGAVVPGLRHHRRWLCDRAAVRPYDRRARDRPWCRSGSGRTGFRA